MKQQYSKTDQTFLAKGTGSFITVDKPKPPKGGGDPRYSMQLIGSNSDKATY